MPISVPNGLFSSLQTPAERQSRASIDHGLQYETRSRPQALRNDRVSATIGSVRGKDFVANRQRLSKSWRLPDFADLRLQS
jgi:hypothetical protein